MRANSESWWGTASGGFFFQRRKNMVDTGGKDSNFLRIDYRLFSLVPETGTEPLSYGEIIVLSHLVGWAKQRQNQMKLTNGYIAERLQRTEPAIKSIIKTLTTKNIIKVDGKTKSLLHPVALQIAGLSATDIVSAKKTAQAIKEKKEDKKEWYQQLSTVETMSEMEQLLKRVPWSLSTAIINWSFLYSQLLEGDYKWNSRDYGLLKTRTSKEVVSAGNILDAIESGCRDIASFCKRDAVEDERQLLDVLNTPRFSKVKESVIKNAPDDWALTLKMKSESRGNK
jgi:hypothetical protein